MHELEGIQCGSHILRPLQQRSLSIGERGPRRPEIVSNRWAPWQHDAAAAMGTVASQCVKKGTGAFLLL